MVIDIFFREATFFIAAECRAAKILSAAVVVTTQSKQSAICYCICNGHVLLHTCFFLSDSELQDPVLSSWFDKMQSNTIKRDMKSSRRKAQSTLCLILSA